jgi:hypothetical protein
MRFIWQIRAIFGNIYREKTKAAVAFFVRHGILPDNCGSRQSGCRPVPFAWGFLLARFTSLILQTV